MREITKEICQEKLFFYLLTIWKNTYFYNKFKKILKFFEVKKSFACTWRP